VIQRNKVPKANFKMPAPYLTTQVMVMVLGKKLNLHY